MATPGDKLRLKFRNNIQIGDLTTKETQQATLVKNSAYGNGASDGLGDHINQLSLPWFTPIPMVLGTTSFLDSQPVRNGQLRLIYLLTMDKAPIGITPTITLRSTSKSTVELRALFKLAIL